MHFSSFCQPQNALCQVPHPFPKPFKLRGAKTRGSGDFELSGRENSENTTPARHPQASPFQGPSQASEPYTSPKTRAAFWPPKLRKHDSRTPPPSVPLPGHSYKSAPQLRLLSLRPQNNPETCGSGDFELAGRQNSENATPAPSTPSLPLPEHSDKAANSPETRE